jgi:ribosomal protein L11 methyltransferase
MDPGLAFGTGHHASTQLALLLLETLFQQYHYKIEKVLDVGTGSGILAMACGLFGAREIMAVDNDPEAVETAKQNIARNHLEDKVTASGQATASLEAGFDIVVANITHDTLAALAATLARLVIQNGFLVLSGILKGEQEDSMREIYTRLGLKLIKNLARDEWAALLFQKK